MMEKIGIRMDEKALVKNWDVMLQLQVVVVVVIIVIIYVSFFLTHFLPKLKNHLSIN
jgi:uncharacterized membrane protein AbrB (regulator of aidB expression)